MRLRVSNVAVALGLFAALQPYRPVVVKGMSMAPTFRSGEILVGDTRLGKIQRGDVVIFQLNGETMVKRVAFLPGDRIDAWKIGGQPSYAYDSRAARLLRRANVPRCDQTVPEDFLFVLGDNSRISLDSRYYGPVPISNVISVLHNIPEPPHERPAGFEVGVDSVSRA